MAAALTPPRLYTLHQILQHAPLPSNAVIHKPLPNIIPVILFPCRQNRRAHQRRRNLNDVAALAEVNFHPAHKHLLILRLLILKMTSPEDTFAEPRARVELPATTLRL